MLKDFTKEAFDIVIQAGQSNAEGSGFGDAAMPYQPKDNVYMMEPDRTVFKAREIVWDNAIRGNFALSFADAYLNAGLLREGRKLKPDRAALCPVLFLFCIPCMPLRYASSSRSFQLPKK